jgi:hypothetical protein
VWNTDGWEKQKTRFLQLPPGRTPSAQSDTRVQFHQDQIQFLVVHETQLAIFEATKLECLKQVCLLSSMCYLIDFIIFFIVSYMNIWIYSGLQGILLHRYRMQHFRATAS